MRATACLLVLLGAQRASACSFIVANHNLTAMHSRSELADANYFNQRRGPDATNVQMAHGWFFLHNLLTMTGVFMRQPFLSHDRQVVALFNGEIYNYRSVAKELEGDEGAFCSDGQALLPAYERWGVDFVKKFEGEFAIIIVDFRKGVILLSTDAFSTKPLWHATWKGDAGQPMFMTI